MCNPGCQPENTILLSHCSHDIAHAKHRPDLVQTAQMLGPQFWQSVGDTRAPMLCMHLHLPEVEGIPASEALFSCCPMLDCTLGEMAGMASLRQARYRNEIHERGRRRRRRRRLAVIQLMRSAVTAPHHGREGGGVVPLPAREGTKNKTKTKQKQKLAARRTWRNGRYCRARCDDPGAETSFMRTGGGALPLCMPARFAFAVSSADSKSAKTALLSSPSRPPCTIPATD